MDGWSSDGPTKPLNLIKSSYAEMNCVMHEGQLN